MSVARKRSSQRNAINEGNSNSTSAGIGNTPAATNTSGRSNESSSLFFDSNSNSNSNANSSTASPSVIMGSEVPVSPSHLQNDSSMNNINPGHGHSYFAPSSHGMNTTRRRRTHSKNLNHSHLNVNMNMNMNSSRSPSSTVPTPPINNRPSIRHNHRRHGSINIRRDREQQEPTLSTTVSDLMFLLHSYLNRALRKVYKRAPRILRNLFLLVVLAVLIFATLMVVIVLRFIHLDAGPLCSPPYGYSYLDQHVHETSGGRGGGGGVASSNSTHVHQPRPLVEYYVHGRGNGHYARSVAIVESLLSKGVDVRMFIGRATMWRAVNEARAGDKRSGGSQQRDQFHSNQQKGTGTGTNEGDAEDLKDHPGGEPGADVGATTTTDATPRGQVTVTSVASLLPSMSIADSLSLLVERVMSDCEVAKNTKRYPVLVISDGDWPGMWRAKIGSIPMVAVSHGQTFVIGHVPGWVKNDPILTQAWRAQRTLNARTSRDADWLIATNFVDIPVKGENGVVARSPMRPEVVRMGKERQIRKKQMKYMNKEGDVLLGGGKMAVDADRVFMEPWQSDELNALLFGEDMMNALKVVKDAIQNKQIKALPGIDTKLTRRKLVICYFRDKNGDLLTNALLRSGFDVVLFERGYHKGLSDEDGEKKFGQNLMVHRDPNPRRVSENTNGDEVPLKEYWADILSKHDHKLLEDDEFEDGSAADSSNEQAAKGEEDVEKGDVNKNSDAANKNAGSPSHYEEQHDLQKLQDSIDKVKNLLKSSADAPRIFRVTDMSLFVPLLSIADGVASSAGSQLLSECIYSHLNVLALHREDDSEQRLNIAFSKHRFDRLKIPPKDVPSQGSLNGENIGYYATENVVHGMSQEKFASVFEMISRHKEVKDKFETILTEAEESMLLRTPESIQTYADFKAYVEAVRQSPISWSYYHDLFFGIVENHISAGRNSMTASNKMDGMDVLGEHDGVGGGGVGDDIPDEYIDPFQGMPEAASVIVEIIDDLTSKSSAK